MDVSHLCIVTQILLICINTYSMYRGNEVGKGVGQVNVPHAACPL